MKGRGSRLTLRSALAESWTDLATRPGRALVAGLGVALGIAAVVVTSTLTNTIRFQVSDEFDARLATQVEIRPPGSADDALPSPFPPPGANVITDLDGVEGVAILRAAQQDPQIAVNDLHSPTVRPVRTALRGINSEGFEALGARISGAGWSGWHEDATARVAVVGSAVAEDIGVQPEAGEIIFVDGLQFTVVGVLDESPRLPGLSNTILVPLTTLEHFVVEQSQDRMIVVTQPGAAQVLAPVLPAALDPAQPDGLIAYTPLLDESLRRGVDDQLQGLALVLGGVVLVLGTVSIGNVTMASVLQRIPEIGLRRALGALPRHILWQIVLDAATIGLAGGMIGALFGTTAALGAAAMQGWQPVIEPAVLLGAVLAGAFCGAIAGAYPARIASRLQPTEALRRE